MVMMTDLLSSHCNLYVLAVPDNNITQHCKHNKNTYKETETLKN